MSGVLLSGAIVTFHNGWMFLIGISLFNQVVLLWQQKFLIAPEKQRALFIEKMFMDFFMAPYYVIALVKTIIKPNAPFRVTNKYREQGYQDNSFAREFVPQWTYLFFDVAVLTTYVSLYGVVFSNLLIYPIIVSFLMNLYMLLTVSSKSVNGGQENPLFVRTIISVENILFNRADTTSQVEQVDLAESSMDKVEILEVGEDQQEGLLFESKEMDIVSEQKEAVKLKINAASWDMPKINSLRVGMLLLPLEQAI